MVAAGGLRRAGPESVVATGEAAPRAHAPAPREAARGGEGEAVAAGRPGERAGALRWGFALAVLVILAVGMVAALGAIEKL